MNLRPYFSCDVQTAEDSYKTSTVAYNSVTVWLVVVSFASLPLTAEVQETKQQLTQLNKLSFDICITTTTVQY